MTQRVHRIFRINVEGLSDIAITKRVDKFKESYTNNKPGLNYLDYFIPVKYGDSGLEIIETET